MKVVQDAVKVCDCAARGDGLAVAGPLEHLRHPQAFVAGRRTTSHISWAVAWSGVRAWTGLASVHTYFSAMRASSGGEAVVVSSDVAGARPVLSVPAVAGVAADTPPGARAVAALLAAGAGGRER